MLLNLYMVRSSSHRIDSHYFSPRNSDGLVEQPVQCVFEGTLSQRHRMPLPSFVQVCLTSFVIYHRNPNNAYMNPKLVQLSHSHSHRDTHSSSRSHRRSHSHSRSYSRSRSHSHSHTKKYRSHSSRHRHRSRS